MIEAVSDLWAAILAAPWYLQGVAVVLVGVFYSHLGEELRGDFVAARNEFLTGTPARPTGRVAGSLTTTAGLGLAGGIVIVLGLIVHPLWWVALASPFSFRCFSPAIWPVFCFRISAV